MSGSVRAARVALADALIATAEYTDARTHLDLALRDPGDDPPSWAIHRRLATVAVRIDEPLSEIQQLLRVACEAPSREAGDAGITLRELLDDNMKLADALTADDVRKLVARATGEEGSPELLRTAARVSLARGDTAQAAKLVAMSGDPQLISDPGLTAARVITEAYDRIIAGAEEAALALLDEHMLAHTDGVVAAVRALACYGLWDFVGALETLDRAPTTYQGAVVRALAALALAGIVDEDKRANWYDIAEKAAAEAARLEPPESETREALLLRAQAALERGGDLAEAGRLLDRALLRVPDAAEFQWWRVQHRVRQGDDRFRFVQVQVAAARHDDHEVLSIWDQIDQHFVQGSTTRLQDAALASAVAAALERSDRSADAANAYRSAASSIEQAISSESAGDLADALAARAAAYRLEHNPGDALKMAELHWQRSVTDDPCESKAETTQGLAVLDGLQGFDDIDHDLGAYLRGLLLARRAGETDSALRSRWEPLPWLLVAALADPDEPYRSAHLAYALNNADLAYQALHFGERALEIGGRADTWLRETAIVMRFNWHGSLSGDSSTLMEGLDESWQQAIFGKAALLDDDPVRMCEFLPHITFDAPWAHEARGVMTARCHGRREAFPILERLRAADTTTRPMVATVSLYLSDVTGARRALEDWEKREIWDPDEAREVLAMCDLLDSDGEQGRDMLEARLAGLRRPFLLREFARDHVPMLLLTYDDRRGAAHALAELRDLAERHLAELDAEPPSLLDGYVDKGKIIDPETQEYVRRLITVTDILQRDADGDATSEIAALISMAPTGPLAAALQVLLSRLPSVG